MKKTSLILAGIFSAMVFMATPELCEASQPVTPWQKSTIGTEHNFDDKLVSGQYQYPDEATATVDDEKMMDDLIGVRKNFKDRLLQSSDRR